MAGLISLRPVAFRLFAACLVIFVSVGAMSVFLACSRVDIGPLVQTVPVPAVSVEPGNPIVYPAVLDLDFDLASGVQVRYSLSEPGASAEPVWLEYNQSQPVRIDRPRELSFYAYRDEKNVSAIRMLVYPFRLPRVSALPLPDEVDGFAEIALDSGIGDSWLLDLVSIRYTNDGSEPLVDTGSLYEEPIELAVPLTIRARAFAGQWEPSFPEVFDYSLVDAGTISSVSASPPGLPAGESYPSGQLVSLSCPTPGVAIHYTLDGSEPSAGSALYIVPLYIDRGRVLKAIAFEKDSGRALLASGILTEEYVFRGQVRISLDPSLPLSAAEAGLSLSILPEDFSGELSTEETMTISVEDDLPDEPESRSWYLDGVLQPGLSGQPSIMVGPGQDTLPGLGNHRLTAELVKNGFSYTAFTSFRMVAP